MEYLIYFIVAVVVIVVAYYLYKWLKKYPQLTAVIKHSGVVTLDSEFDYIIEFKNPHHESVLLNYIHMPMDFRKYFTVIAISPAPVDSNLRYYSFAKTIEANSVLVVTLKLNALKTGRFLQIFEIYNEHEQAFGLVVDINIDESKIIY